MKITESVFLDMFEKFKNTVYAVVFNYVKNAEDAADLQQDVFVKLFRSDVEFESEEHIKAWLLRVSVNLCKNHLRSRSRFSDAPLSEKLPAQVKEEAGDLLAVTGDAQTPKLVFDVRVNDPNVTQGNDRIFLSAYTLGVEQYENELDKYAMCEGGGYQDAENPNLYHVVMDGAPVWLSYGEPCVVSVREIRFRHIARPYEVNMEYRLEVPPMDLHPVVSDYFGGVLVSDAEDGYYLDYANYGAYYTELIFMFDYDGKSMEGKYTTREGLESLLQMKWRDYADDLRLVVDGTEYEALANEAGYVWYDNAGESRPKNRCYVAPRFPAVDYHAARKITLKQGNEEYRLK